MFSADTFFVMSMQQHYGVTDLRVKTMARHFFTYTDERGKPATVAKPVLVFNFRGHGLEVAMPMRVTSEWVTSEHGIAMQAIYAECAWTAADVESCIKRITDDLKDNLKVKGIV